MLVVWSHLSRSWLSSSSGMYSSSDESYRYTCRDPKFILPDETIYRLHLDLSPSNRYVLTTTFTGSLTSSLIFADSRKNYPRSACAVKISRPRPRAKPRVRVHACIVAEWWRLGDHKIEMLSFGRGGNNEKWVYHLLLVYQWRRKMFCCRGAESTIHRHRRGGWALGECVVFHDWCLSRSTLVHCESAKKYLDLLHVHDSTATNNVCRCSFIVL